MSRPWKFGVQTCSSAFVRFVQSVCGRSRAKQTARVARLTPPLHAHLDRYKANMTAILERVSEGAPGQSSPPQVFVMTCGDLDEAATQKTAEENWDANPDAPIQVCTAASRGCSVAGYSMLRGVLALGACVLSMRRVPGGSGRDFRKPPATHPPSRCCVAPPAFPIFSAISSEDGRAGGSLRPGRTGGGGGSGRRPRHRLVPSDGRLGCRRRPAEPGRPG